MYLLAKGRLMTNKVSVDWGLGVNDKCSRCKSSVETCFHEIRNYGFVKVAWRRVVKSSRWDEFCSLDLLNWIERRLSGNWGREMGYSWNVLFSCLL